MSLTTKFAGYRVAFAIFLILFMTMGTIASLSVYLAPITLETDLTLPEVMLSFSIATMVAAITGLFAPTIIAKVTPKWALMAGTILMGLFGIACSFTQDIWPMYIGCFLAGLAVAIGTNAAAGALIGQWFIDKRVHVTGIVFGGCAFGGAVFSFISGFLIEGFGFRFAFICLAIPVLVIGILTNLFLVRSPEQLGQKALGWEKEDEMNAIAAAAGQNLQGLDSKEARRTGSYWMIFLGLLLTSTGATIIQINLSAFLITAQEYAVSQASTLASIGMVVASLLMIGTGFILSKLKVKPFLFIAFAGVIAANLIFALVPQVPFALALTAAVLSMFVSPVIGPMAATFSMDSFGNKDFGKIMGFMIAAVTVGSVFTPLLTSAILRAFDNYALLFFIAVALCLLAMVLLLTGLSTAPMVKARKALEARKAVEGE
jgi:MFS family permease